MTSLGSLPDVLIFPNVFSHKHFQGHGVVMEMNLKHRGGHLKDTKSFWKSGRSCWYVEEHMPI